MPDLRRPPIKTLFFAAVIAVALAIAVTVPWGLSPVQAQTLGLVLVAIVIWATGVLPGYLASLILFTVALIGGLASPQVLFAGFGSTAVWLIVSGFVIGAAVTATGWNDRLAAAVAPLLSGSYAATITGLMAIAMLLGFIMPSSIGRAVILIPVGMAVARDFGFDKGSNGRVGIACILAIGCNMPSFAILPSNIPNVIFASAAETLYGTHFGYLEYLTLHYPVLGLLKAIVTVVIVLKAYPARISAEPAAVTPAARIAPLDAPALRVAAILLATVAFWASDSLHGINAAWIGLAAAVLLLLPRIGVVDQQRFRSSVDFSLLLFITGALAVGALLNTSGLGQIIGETLEGVLPLAPGQGFLNFVSLTVMAVITGVFSTMPGIPVILSPLAEGLAQHTGLDLRSVLMTQVIAFSTVIFPYQVAPIVVAMILAGERVSALLWVLVPLAVVTLLVLLPIDYLWWHLLGWI